MSTEDLGHEEFSDERIRRVRKAAARWQRHLVDLGGRNSLLWQRSDPGVELDLTTAHPAGVAKLLSGRTVTLAEIVREPNAYKVAYDKAISIRDLSAELMEERGIISCFLALGRATWQMDGDVEADAPVLLRQCDIHFGGREGTDLILEVSRTVELNSALATYLSARGVNIDQAYLTSLASGPHGFDPGPTFDMLRKAGASIPGFTVTDKIVLSTYSYAKLSMVRDLTDQRGWLHEHPVIAGMAGDTDAMYEVADVQEVALELDPDDEFLVLDANSRQQAAIEAVMQGQHLVLMGPPGTGKSQTIANLIATLAAHGRSALFVAEKRAAIDAVLGRLDEVRLEDLVLDAHSGSGTAADLIHGLAERLVTSRPADGGQHVDADLAERLERTRNALLEHVRALHRVRDPFGVSASDAQTAIAEFVAQDVPPRSRVRLEGDTLRNLDEGTRDEIGHTLVQLAQRKAWRDDGKPDPWFGARVRGEENLLTTRNMVTKLADGEFTQHHARLDELFAEAGLPKPQTMADATAGLDLMAHVARTLEVFSPEVFSDNLNGYVEATTPRQERAGAGQGMMERRRLLKEARATLRPGRPPADLHGALERAARESAQWRELGGVSTPKAPAAFEKIAEEQAHLNEDLDWLGLRLEGTEGAADLFTMPLSDVDARLRELSRTRGRLDIVPLVGPEIERLRARGLSPVIDDFAARGLGPDRVEAEWNFIWWTSVLAHVRHTDEAYEAQRGAELRSTASAFEKADREHRDDTASRVRYAVERRIDQVAREHPEQVEALEAAVVYGRQVGSADMLRSAFAAAPDLMTALAPAWAMSPLVVAQTIPPGVWFDVVIFDEASQIPPAEAVSAISRGVQVVVAGDRQQLAPTSFYQRAASGEESAHTGESILDVLAGLLPVQQLTWHYRSLDERLIAFSNEAVYDGELVTFPRAQVENVLQLHVIPPYPGEEVRTDARTSAEVDAVVRLVKQHVHERPKESLGVITLGLAHADDIEHELTRAAHKDAALAEFMNADSPAPFFVKNLERVQGDERDAIILSLGIDPMSPGSSVKRFGSLNHAGGDRRLNVAISRARKRMDVVSRFAGEDLDPSLLRSRGVTLLRDFLLYVAECDERLQTPDTSAGIAIVGGKRRRTDSSGSVALKRVGGEVVPLQSPYVMRDLAARLREHGLKVHSDYGHSRTRIDLAIEHPYRPGTMLLAIESDGEPYAHMGTVRERDRLRVEALRRLGWRHDRVWTVDLFRDPARDASRIADLVQELADNDFDD